MISRCHGLYTQCGTTMRFRQAERRFSLPFRLFDCLGLAMPVELLFVAVLLTLAFRFCGLADGWCVPAVELLNSQLLLVRVADVYVAMASAIDTMQTAGLRSPTNKRTTGGGAGVSYIRWSCSCGYPPERKAAGGSLPGTCKAACRAWRGRTLSKPAFCR